ncbi:BCAM0308 family protein [Solemya velum gill symbiont]|uniref:ATPase n=1 Tax=Solemya velum gill symbiont TaxID=2340 RepID=A0A0B0HBL1_SOVGS|nr:BCAM0308 family protein [Solemya velum gill symbiont]KHF24821.1 hypothetical protein JV46_08210 [Solemya velum gill symbiont]OOY51884.1 ATPase [Solemya velum gill symbiont]OOY55994.1 ATPase [Solemya velum gill symbiont]OOY57318.1 ATPase [Solemya velum gill symbiont]OOY60178.1 ATPase [Solemya velum gill symbiont]
MSGKEGNVAQHGRQDRLLKEHVHDPYMASKKLSEPTVCPRCHVVYSGARWQWKSETPECAYEEVCPACRRIQDKVPAGILTLKGDFFEEHRGEIMRMVHHHIEDQMELHPMKRLMGVVEEDNENSVLLFTDTHLPRSVGEAVEHAFKGELDIHYTKESGIVRVYWQR